MTFKIPHPPSVDGFRRLTCLAISACLLVGLVRLWILWKMPPDWISVGLSTMVVGLGVWLTAQPPSSLSPLQGSNALPQTPVSVSLLWGGEEFLALLSGMTLGQATVHGKGLRAAMEELIRVHGPLTISVGVSN